MPELRLAWVWGAAVAGLLLAETAASTVDVKVAHHSYTIVVENMRFDPQTLTVKSGDRITWLNKDLFPHTASADGKAFDSRGIAPNASWTWVVRKPGSYSYACAFHTTMKGTVIVQ